MQKETQERKEERFERQLDSFSYKIIARISKSQKRKLAGEKNSDKQIHPAFFIEQLERKIQRYVTKNKQKRKETSR